MDSSVCGLPKDVNSSTVHDVQYDTVHVEGFHGSILPGLVKPAIVSVLRGVRVNLTVKISPYSTDRMTSTTLKIAKLTTQYHWSTNLRQPLTTI